MLGLGSFWPDKNLEKRFDKLEPAVFGKNRQQGLSYNNCLSSLARGLWPPVVAILEPRSSFIGFLCEMDVQSWTSLFDCEIAVE